MKGIVLAGGTGSRLDPLTKVTNKHLLPVFDKPMVLYPIEALVLAGITDIMLVTGGEWASDFARLLGDGSEYGATSLVYGYQKNPLGIAHALGLARDFVKDEKFCVFLGDNVLEGNTIEAKQSFESQEDGAKVLLKEVPDPENFGCPEIDHDRIVRVIEKPTNPPTSYAVVGIYFYDSNVFEFIETLQPSERGELEISDVNSHYAERGQLTFDIIHGWWGDAGESIKSWLRVNNLVAETGANKQTLKS